MYKITLSIFLTVFTLLGHGQSINTKVLKSKKWLTQSATSSKPIDLNQKGTSSTDVLSQSPFCISDDIFIFKDKGFFIKDDNQYDCPSLSKSNGSWKVIGKDTLSIKLDKESDFINFRVIKLDKNKLILLANMPFLPNGVDITYVFKAK
jgi:hypothetical protein